MSPVLDGVRIGPLDPDRGESFGQVGGQSTARQLLRHHAAMNPPALQRALRRVRQDRRTDAVDKEEAAALVRAFYKEAGEPLPDDSLITGFAVRGEEDQPDEQVLTFTFTSKSGHRTGKGFVPYQHDDLSKTRAAGDEAVRIEELKKAGLPWAPSEAALAAAGIGGTGVAAADEDAAAVAEARATAEERDALRSEVEELRERLAEVEGQAPNDEQERQADEEPELPWDGYEDAKAQDVRRRIREERDPDLARRVLAWETRPDGGANRSTVTGAANEVLDHAPAPGGE